jgi:predicted nucleotidyltransferase component of viral defense system
MHPIIEKLRNIKEYLVEKNMPENTIKVALKEHLQSHILNAIYKNAKYSNLIFYGGTSLRKLYDLNRMSEDLDFESLDKIDLEEMARYLIKYFNSLAFDRVDFNVQEGERVSRITIKFPILYDIGLSPNISENLHVKVEINHRISGVYPTELTPLMMDSMSAILKHYDIQTLMAGKITACLDRVYEKGKTGIVVKGRDYYDLVWYMQKGIIPNEKKLLDVNKEYTLKNVFNLLNEKVAKISTRDLLTDLDPLFSEKEFIREWCKNFHEFYKRFRVNY